MEYIDIVNENGKPTGEVKSRDEVHIKGLLHRHIHIWIINSNGGVLLQKRAASKKTYPNVWAMSAEGHVQSGKTPGETASDEIREELGINIKKIPSPAFSFAPGIMKFGEDWIENGINIVYFLKYDIPLEKIEIQKSEVSAVRWMNREDYRLEIEDKNPEYRLYPEEFPRLFECLDCFSQK